MTRAHGAAPTWNWRSLAAWMSLPIVLLTAGMPGLHAAAPPGPDGGDGMRLPGKFVWFELVTDDLAAQAAFYQAVFSWTFRAVPGAPASYHVIENDGSRIAGMFARPSGQGGARGARWLALVSVPDVAAAARYAAQQGGSVVAQPATIAGRGTHALLRDPDGALFGALLAQGGDPPDTPVADGDFFWLDLFARAPARAAEFYRGLAGYEISTRESELGFTRQVLQSQGYARAGIVPMPGEVKEAGWLPYVLVRDVPATLDKVAAAKGRVVVRPDPRMLDGNVAVIADPLGGVLGIVNWDVAQGDGEGQ